MPKLQVLSNRNQVDHYPTGDGGTLTIVPGSNSVDEAKVKAAIATTDGNDTGFRARIAAGDYEVRVSQMVVKKRV